MCSAFTFFFLSFNPKSRMLEVILLRTRISYVRYVPYISYLTDAERRAQSRRACQGYRYVQILDSHFSFQALLLATKIMMTPTILCILLLLNDPRRLIPCYGLSQKPPISSSSALNSADSSAKSFQRLEVTFVTGNTMKVRSGRIWL